MSENTMTEMDTSSFFGAGKSSEDFDQWDRYLLPDEDGTKSGWTRATTFASTLAEQYGLTQWHQRMVVWGLSRRPDLLALANTIAGPEDKKALGEIVKEAHVAAGTEAKANAGTALHAACEAYDKGEPVPSMHEGDVHAYVKIMNTYDYQTNPLWIERVVIVPSHHVAGKFDRLVMCPDGKVRVADIKTGNLDYASLEFSIQLSLYANASAMYSYGAQAYEPLPPIEKDYAIIVHIKPGSGVATIYRVNIEIGWALTRLCGEVRDARKLKHLITPMPAAPTDAQRLTKSLEAVPARTYRHDSEPDHPMVDGPTTYQRSPGTVTSDLMAAGLYVGTPEEVARDLAASPWNGEPAEVFWDDPRHAETPDPEPVSDGSQQTEPGASESVPENPDWQAVAEYDEKADAATGGVDELAQAIVKSAKGKANVQQIARDLMASLGLPETVIKLNQQQIKIARAIVELAHSRGVPVPGITIEHEPTPTQVLQQTFAANPEQLPDALAQTPKDTPRVPAAEQMAKLKNDQLLIRIRQATAVPDLLHLRESLGAGWTEEMTEAARIRADELEGSEQLTPAQMIEGATSKATLSLAWKVATDDGARPDGWTTELHTAAQAKLAALS